MTKDQTLSTKVVQDQAIPTGLAKNYATQVLVIQQTFIGLLVCTSHCSKYKNE